MAEILAMPHKLLFNQSKHYVVPAKYSKEIQKFPKIPGGPKSVVVKRYMYLFTTTLLGQPGILVTDFLSFVQDVGSLTVTGMRWVPLR